MLGTCILLAGVTSEALVIIGLPISLSTLLAIFVALLVLRAVLIAGQDTALTGLRLDFIKWSQSPMVLEHLVTQREGPEVSIYR